MDLVIQDTELREKAELNLYFLIEVHTTEQTQSLLAVFAEKTFHSSHTNQLIQHLSLYRFTKLMFLKNIA